MLNEIDFFNENNINNELDNKDKIRFINMYFNNELKGFNLNSNSILFERLQISIKDLKTINFLTFDNLINNYYLRNKKGFKGLKNNKILVICHKNGNNDNISLKILSKSEINLKSFERLLKVNPYQKRKAYFTKKERNLIYILKNIKDFNFKYSYNFSFFDNLKNKETEILKDFNKVSDALSIVNKKIKQLDLTFKEYKKEYVYLSLRQNKTDKQKAKNYIQKRKNKLIQKGLNLEKKIRKLKDKRKKIYSNYLIELNKLNEKKTDLTDKYIYSVNDEKTTLNDFENFQYSKSFLTKFDNKPNYYQIIKKYKDF